jgi:hypothetical protein
MKTVSIGIMREDGDFAVLATLNNNDEHLSVDVFKTLVEGVRTYMEAMSKQTVIVLERQDTPDYVEI